MISFRTLADIKPCVLHATFLDAFSTYLVPVNDSLAEFNHLLERRGADLNLSLGAFDGKNLIGFVVNGFGCWGYRQTAYDVVTGIRSAYQNKGIARRLFEHLFPLLANYGIEQYLLEVIPSNRAAVRLYERMGFTVTRSFRCFQADLPALNLPLDSSPLRPVYNVVEIKKPDWETFQTFWDGTPSWQNSVDAIERTPAHFKIRGAFTTDTCIGYGVVETATGDVPQLAVHKDYRRHGIGTALMATLHADCRRTPLKMINVETSNDTLAAFLRAKGFRPTVEQHEMIRSL